ncbi:MAG: methionyl-tRNA formyltransferase [bacterium]|nr:methionyl-tRNA formyltransferase [bacterium]
MKKVRVIYDPILRQEVKPVTVFDDELKKLSEEMFLVMHKNIGMGLAANQLGVDKDLLVIEYRPANLPAGEDKGTKAILPIAICNAKVTKSSKETDTFVEGCLSLPGLELSVARPSGVTVEGQDLSGKSVVIKAKGLLARILQHEVDHLDGVLFTDRATGVKNIKNYNWAKIVFFGSDQFSSIILEGLINAGLNVMAVVTETDKRAGRGDQLVAPLIKNLALENQVAVVQPETKEEITSILKQLQPDLVILASYGKILPAEALEVPTYGALNVHPSLLPKYRGATPLQSAILDGEKETGVTIMKMNAGVDTGEIVAQTKIGLSDTETFISLRDQLSQLGARLLASQLPMYLSGQTNLQFQGSDTTTTKKLTKEMGEIDWSEQAEIIDRKVRALNPWPGTFTFVGDKRLKVLEANLKDGKLSLKTVQLEGKSLTSWPEFVRGYEQQLKNCSWYGKIS